MNLHFVNRVEIAKANIMVEVAYSKRNVNMIIGSLRLMIAPFPRSIINSRVMKKTATSIKPRYLRNHAIHDSDGLRPIIFINSW